MSFIVGNHLINLCGCILCCFCETRVAFVEDYVPNAQDSVYGGYFRRLFHVIVVNKANYHQQRDGNTLANIYCIQCRILIGWELIAVTQPSEYFKVGRFFMRLKQLMYQNGVTLHDSLFVSANEQAPNDLDGGTNGQDHDQAVGADDHNDADQDGGASDQVGGANEQDVDANNNEKNADQDKDANEQNHDEDGGTRIKRMKM